MLEENAVPTPQADDNPAPPPGFQPGLAQAAPADTPPPPPGFQPGIAAAPAPEKTFGQKLKTALFEPTEAMEEQVPADFAQKHPTLMAIEKASILPQEVNVGGLKEGLKTIRGVAELANKGLQKVAGADAPQIPTGDASTLETHGVAQNIGGLGEGVAEFAMGDEVLKGISWLDSLGKSPRVLELMEKFPKTAKLIMGAAKGAAIGAPQGTVKAAGEGRDPVEGAKEGAEGGAAGGTIGEALPMVVKPLAKSIGLGTSAEEDIMRAAQPGKRNYRFLENWKDAAPYLRNEIEEGGKFSDFNDAAERIRDVRQKLWNEEIEPKIAKHAAEDIFAKVPAGQPNPVGQAVRDAVPKSRFTGKMTKSAEAFAKKFDGPMTVDEANRELAQFNAELDNKGYWKKTPSERAAMEKADDFVSNRVAATEALRDQLYTHLEQSGEPDVAKLKKTYGAIKNVESEIRGQVNVAGRQRPMSLKQIIGLTSGIAHGGPLGAASAMIPVLDKIYNSPEALLNRAIEKTTPAGPVRQAIQAGIKGALSGNVVSATGRWVMMKDEQGNHYEIHPEDVPEAQKRDPSLQPVDNQPADVLKAPPQQ